MAPAVGLESLMELKAPALGLGQPGGVIWDEGDLEAEGFKSTRDNLCNKLLSNVFIQQPKRDSTSSSHYTYSHDSD